METIGEKIYRLRKQKSFSQEELAFRVGVSRQTISKWEAGTMHPNMENVKTLCEVLGIDIDYFLSDEKNRETIKEIANTAISENEKEEKHSGTKSMVNIGLVISIIFVGILLLVSMCLTMVTGFVSLTSNKGDVVVTTSKIDEWMFIVCLVTSILLALLELYLSMKLYKKRKSKVLVTTM